LAGPKIRIGKIKAGAITLESGALFTLTNQQHPGDEKRVSISYPNLPREVKPGDTLLLGDGALELKVLESTGQDVRCRVIIGGRLSSFKGINLPSRSIKAPSLTKKDKEDLAFGIENEVDYVALSFVRSAADVRTARNFIKKRGSAIPIIAKIEKHEALENIDEIIHVVEGIMIARGDLGVETPLEKVPLVQKLLIKKSNQAGKPVITATQMLRSMVDSPRPTRAEVTDVANAIFDGTDAVMLSEETATGKYPVKAAATMARIAKEAESGFPFETWTHMLEPTSGKSLPEAVSCAACNLAESINASAIITFTQTGSTARLVAKCRPRRPILAMTPLEETYRCLALVWGVVPFLSETMKDTDEMIDRAFKVALHSGIVKRGQIVVITAGSPVGVPGTTNLIKAEVLK
jgi:pyruvate kinase